MRFMTNQKIFKMRTCVIIKISTNLFSMKDTTRHTIHLQQLSKNFTKCCSSGLNSVSNRKSAGFQVVANLITVIESVSKFELDNVVKKLLTK